MIVPSRHRKAVLEELHEAHPGMTRMKGLARMFVWWPGIDGDIERTVRLCRECQTSLSSPPLAPLQPWKWPTRPWSGLHIDYAGPMYGKMCLIIVDAHSKWIEAAFVPSATSAATIELLRNSFARFGLPSSVVTDNAPYFVSEEIELFFKQNGIRHPTSLPYHPASNGLVERAVQTIKKGLRKVTEGTLNTRLSKVLFTYRVTPHATTGVSPAELLLHYQPRTRLDLLFPQIADRVENQQSRQTKLHDRTAQQRNFTQGQAVYARNFREGERWIPGYVVEVTGPVSYNIELEDGRHWKRHQDHIRSRLVVSNDSSDIPIPDTTLSGTPSESFPVLPESPPMNSTSSPVEPESQLQPSVSEQSRRYPVRERRPPERFQ